MSDAYLIAGGSVQGADHVRFGRNNQDAFHWSATGDVTVAVVCDGCGSGRRSEVGALIGAPIIAEAVHEALRRSPLDCAFVPASIIEGTFHGRVMPNVVATIRLLANSMGGSLSSVINENFLFTVVGAVVTRRTATIFSLGDGVYAVNDEVVRLGPFPNNRPPYLGYNIVRTVGMDGADSFDFTLRHFAIAEVQTLLLGSDGVGDLIDAGEQCIPGTSHAVGPLNQFWSERMFSNPDMVRRRLAVINREPVRFENLVGDERLGIRRVNLGVLRDDTTCVVMRRKA